MSGKVRTALRWGLRVFLALCALEAVHLSVLAFPFPLFRHQERFGGCTIYSDAAIEDDLAAVMRDVNRRLEVSELHGPDARSRVYYCRSQRLYRFFARLALVNPMVQGFNLSLLGVTYVSEPRIAALGSWSGGFPPYGVREGDRAHVIAHEMLHDYTENELGFLTYYRLPHWKREGYAEYGSTIHAIRESGDFSLADRIGILEDDRHWRPGVDMMREYYRGALLVEYLFEIEGYRFADLMREEVTLEESYAAMLGWSSGP